MNKGDPITGKRRLSNNGEGGNTDAKAWKDIWGCGQGIGNIDDVLSAADMVQKLADEYHAASDRLKSITY